MSAAPELADSSAPGSDERPACTLLAGADLRERARALTQAHAAAGAHCSRSYRDPFALAAWFARPVGVDIERVETMPDGFAESIATPEELGALAGRLHERELAASLWAAKEALAKALGDPLRRDPRRLDAPLLWPGGVRGRWRAERLAAPPGHVAWICWRTA